MVVQLLVWRFVILGIRRYYSFFIPSNLLISSPLQYLHSRLLKSHLNWALFRKFISILWYPKIKTFLHQSIAFVNQFVLSVTQILIVLLLQSSVLHSQPKSTVGTPAYIAPEVLLKKEYDGKVLCNFCPQRKFIELLYELIWFL